MKAINTNKEVMHAAEPMGRGLLSLLIAGGIIGTGQSAVAENLVIDKETPDLENDPVRKNLLKRMDAKGIKMLTAKDLSNGNPDNEKLYNEMRNAFYHSGKRGIFLGKDLQRNAILAHEMGHAEDPKFLTALNPIGKMVGTAGALSAAVLRPQQLARAAAKLGTLGYGGTIASEGSASVRGYKILNDAGEKKFSEKIQAASGFPTYLMAALLPGLTYKGRKWLGAFKQMQKL